MKLILTSIFILCTTFLGYSQQYKVKYISYKSDINNEMDGFTMATYKYENCRLTVSNQGKELLIAGTKDAVFLRYFKKIPWNQKIGAYASGFHLEDPSKAEKISYYVQANVSKDLKIIDLRILNRDEVTGKVRDNVILLFNKVN